MDGQKKNSLPQGQSNTRAPKAEAPKAGLPAKAAPQQPVAKAPAVSARPAAPAGKTPAPKPAPQNEDFKERIWKPLLWPIVTLVAICAVTSFLLAFTNNATQPIIEANAAAEADEARRALLPGADGFAPVEVMEGHGNVVSMYEATNGAGYVIEAYGRGYGGRVPALVAFGADGTIEGVTFLANSETPGLGQKLVADTGFAAQFAGRPNLAVQNADVDAIASATISTNAAISAVNAAVALYNEQVAGIDPDNLTPDQVLAMLLPQAGSLTEIKVDIPGVTEAYKGGDGNYIIFATAPGAQEYPVTAGVSMNPAGVVLGLWLDTSTQGEGYGTPVDSNQAFINQFPGRQAPVSVDAVAGATITSNAAAEAVNIALEALPGVKEAG